MLFRRANTMANLGVKKSSFASLDPQKINLIDASQVNEAVTAAAFEEDAGASIIKTQPILEEIFEHEVISPTPPCIPEHLQQRDRIQNQGFKSREPRVKAIIIQEQRDREFLKSLEDQLAKDSPKSSPCLISTISPRSDMQGATLGDADRALSDQIQGGSGARSQGNSQSQDRTTTSTVQQKPGEVASPGMRLSGKTIVMLSKNRDLRPVRGQQNGSDSGVGKLLSLNPKDRLLQKRQSQQIKQAMPPLQPCIELVIPSHDTPISAIGATAADQRPPVELEERKLSFDSGENEKDEAKYQQLLLTSDAQQAQELLQQCVGRGEESNNLGQVVDIKIDDGLSQNKQRDGQVASDFDDATKQGE